AARFSSARFTFLAQSVRQIFLECGMCVARQRILIEDQDTGGGSTAAMIFEGVMNINNSNGGDPILVREWSADAFHRRVIELEASGYVAVQETYNILPEMNPETGEIIHLHSIEMRKRDVDNDIPRHRDAD